MSFEGLRLEKATHLPHLPRLVAPRVLVVMMQRDEGAALGRWLTYYSRVFGCEHLVIIDNGSADPFTLHLLRAAEAAGVRIVRDRNSPRDFALKGVVVTETIQAIEARERYDFVLPVDCDELLAVVTDDRVSVTTVDIVAEFRALLGERQVLRIGMSLFNVPGQSGWFAPNRFFHKGFAAGGELQSLDKGFHVPMTRSGEVYRATRFVYLHYHNVSLFALKRNARRKLAEPYRSCTDEAMLRHYAAQPGVPGAHLIADLLLTSEQYETLYENELQIMVDASAARPAMLHAPDALIMWNAAQYLRAHPDVTGYALGPLYHYILCGWLEGRQAPSDASWGGVTH